MTRFVRSTLFAALGALGLAVGSEAQESPARRPVVPTAPAAPELPRIPVQAWPNGVPYYVTTETEYGDSQPSLLARQIADAKSDTEKEKLKDKLKERLNKQFDDRQKHHESELAALELKVKKLKEMVSRRQENKQEIIEEKIKQLERETKGLGW